MDEAEHLEIWSNCFTLLIKVKKFKDENIKVGKNRIKDLFLATVGCEH